MRRIRPFLVSLLVLGCSAEDEGDPATTVATSSSGPGTSSTGSDDGSGSDGSMSSGSTSASTTDGADETGATDTGADETSAGAETTTGGPSGAVVMETTLGTITIELFPEQAPITVENFIAYIDAGFYDGGDGLEQTIFHRVIPGFVIQGGGLTDALEGKATMAPIVNEHDSSGLTNDRGTLSMARTSDPDSATSQFFINLVDNAGLDDSPGYAVFGQVVEGLDVVDAIGAVETTDAPPYSDVPSTPVYITSVTLE